MKGLYIVKLGGSVITKKGKPFTEDKETIARLAKEIREALGERDIALIVGHGGGSYPHTPAWEYKTAEGITSKRSIEGIVKVQDASARLNRIVVGELIGAGVNAASVEPFATTVSKSGRIAEMYMKPISMMLKLGMVPVPYGDVGLDSEMGCCILSTEEIISYLARHRGELGNYKLKRIIIGGRVSGVFTGNPDKDSNAELIAEITPGSIGRVGKFLGGSSETDVTGGMRQKVMSLLELAEMGVESEILSLLAPGNLKRALAGERGIGTIVRGSK